MTRFVAKFSRTVDVTSTSHVKDQSEVLSVHQILYRSALYSRISICCVVFVLKVNCIGWKELRTVREDGLQSVEVCIDL